VFEKRVLGPKGIKKWEVGEDCVMRSFINYTPRLIKMIKSRRMELAGHVARIGEERN
jgi:hypothetical protein